MSRALIVEAGVNVVDPPLMLVKVKVEDCTEPEAAPVSAADPRINACQPAFGCDC